MTSKTTLRQRWAVGRARVRRWRLLAAVYSPLPWRMNQQQAVALLVRYYAGSKLEDYARTFDITFARYMTHALAMCCLGEEHVRYARRDIWRTIAIYDGHGERHGYFTRFGHEYWVHRGARAGSGGYGDRGPVLPDDLEARLGKVGELPDIPGAMVPKGKSYQWVRESVMGVACANNVAKMRADGWRAVPAKRHPDIHSDDKKRIVISGALLMERSRKLTDAAARRDTELSLSRVQSIKDRQV